MAEKKHLSAKLDLVVTAKSYFPPNCRHYYISRISGDRKLSFGQCNKQVDAGHQTIILEATFVLNTPQSGLFSDVASNWVSEILCLILSLNYED